MAKKKPFTWLPGPSRPKKPSIPETLKAPVDTKAKVLVETVLKPKFIQPPPKKPRFNYIIAVALDSSLQGVDGGMARKPARGRKSGASIK
jgi:hypothetical protein